MCLSPAKLSDGTTVACRKCGQCLDHRVDNWVGRCIAESKTSVDAAFITLTYGRDENDNVSHVRASVLSYSDVQNYFKQLRNRGLKIRYLVVGEVSKQHSMRSHWHVIVFFLEPLPSGFWDYGNNSWCRKKRDDPVWVPLVWDKRFNEPCWPHGFSQWERLKNGTAKGSVRYACKYINKDVDDPSAQSKLCMSKKPPIGALYFEQRAKRFVEQGIAPQDAFYTFPNDAAWKDGKPIRFQLANKSSDLFRENYILHWRGLPKPWGRQGPPVYTGRRWHYPESEYVQEFEDRMNSERHVIDPEFLEWYKEHKKCPKDVTIIGPTANRVHITQTEWLKVRSKRTRLHSGPAIGPLFVLWIKSASQGRYKIGKMPAENGMRVWLKSQMS